MMSTSATTMLSPVRSSLFSKNVARYRMVNTTNGAIGLPSFPVVRWCSSKEDNSRNTETTPNNSSSSNSNSNNNNNNNSVERANNSNSSSFVSSSQTTTTNNATTFPWRSSNLPLSRVLSTSRDDRSGMPQTVRGRYVRCALAARELQHSWWQALFGMSWKQELASDGAWAFERAVAALLSNTFGVSLEEIDQEEYGVMLDSTEMSKPPPSPPAVAAGGESDQPASKESLQRHVPTKTFLAKILEEKLLQLYSTIDPLSIHVLFQMKSMESRLQHAFLVPMLTRDFVGEHPEFKGFFQEMEREFSQTGNYSKVREMGEKLAKETGENGGLRTVICDVSVDCLERVHVTDAHTGKVLVEGGLDAQRVTHLVRMEMVTSLDEGGNRKLGDWQIVDWDDLLEGNVWH